MLNANEFAQRTFFLSESDERKLENGKALKVRANVNALGYWDSADSEEFVAVSCMLESSIDSLTDLVQVNDEGEPVIDPQDLRNSDIPSLMVSNNRSMDIINVSEEQFATLSPGDEVTVEVRLSTDDSGQRYLNGRNLQRVEPEYYEGSNRDELAREPEEVESVQDQE